MKRIIAVSLLFGLLGAATSVSIAWWLTLREQKWEDAREIVHDDWLGQQQSAHGIHLLGAAARDHMTWEEIRPPWVEPGTTETAPPAWSVLWDESLDKSMWVQEVAAGWPLKCMRYTVREGEDPSELPYVKPLDKSDSPWIPGATQEYDGALFGKNYWRGATEAWSGRLLPVGPIWPSLLINSALYGCVLAFVLLRVPHAIRIAVRADRRRRGLCPVCQYDRRHDLRGVCQECGCHVSDRPIVTAAGSVLAALALTLLLIGGLIALVMRFDNDPPFQELHRAAYKGDVNGVRAALNGGADPNQVCEYEPKQGPLHLAARGGSAAVVQALLDAGSIPALPDEEGSTPLEIAVANSASLETVQLLLDAGADVNRAEGYIYDGSALQIAIRRDASLDVIQALLDAGAFVDLKDIRKAHRQLTGRDLNGFDYGGHSPLALAVGHAPVEVVRAVLDAGAEINNTPAVQMACEEGRIDVVRLLIEFGAEVKASNALSLACEAGSIDIVRLLLEAGVEIKPQTGRYALMGAIESGNVELVRLLLDRGAQIDSEVMVQAGGAPSLAVLSVLIARGGNIHSTDENGNNAMSYLCPDPAARPVWEFLAAQGLTVQNVVTKHMTPLLTAVFSESPQLVRFLLDHGADPFLGTKYGTPLHVLVVGWRFDSGNWRQEPEADVLREMIAALVEYGEDVSAMDEDGVELLKNCVWAGRVDTVRILLEFNPNTETALRYAKRIGDKEMVYLLEQADTAGVPQGDDQ